MDLRGDGGTAFGHLHVDVEPFASAFIVLDYAAARVLRERRVHRRDSAKLTLVGSRTGTPTPCTLSQQHTVLGRDSQFVTST